MEPLRSPAEIIADLSTAFMVSRALQVTAELGVADQLNDEPMPADELAARVGAHPRALYRVLRLLAAHGVFKEVGTTFAHTPASRLLRQDNPRSQRAWVRMMGMPINWSAYGIFEHSVKTGTSSRDQLFEGDFFADHLTKNPQLAKLFNESMTAAANRRIDAILNTYDFSPFKVIADIGGGRGHLIRAVLEKTPGARGILFDLPQAADPVRDQKDPRLTITSGNFFNDPLPEADAYLLMAIIHDWSDEESIAILGAVHRAAPEGAKLLLMENVVRDGPGSEFAKRMDIHMLAALSGCERTPEEFGVLLSASGFRFEAVIPTTAGVSIVEATRRS